MRLSSGLLCIALLLGWAPLAPAAPYQFSLQLFSPLPNGLLAFDFLDGGPPSNSVLISNFTTDAILGTPTSVGDVSGDLASELNLSDADFFNEHSQPVSALSTLQFNFTATSNAPARGSVPDSFSFFLLDESSELPLFDTTDPTGANALFGLEIAGSSQGKLLLYGPTTTEPSAQWSVVLAEKVPEPATWLLTLTALGAFAVPRVRRRAR